MSLRRRERVIKFGYLPPEMGLNLKKKTVFISRIVPLDPKLTPHVNFSNFQAEESPLGLPEYKLKVVNICKMHGKGYIEVVMSVLIDFNDM